MSANRGAGPAGWPPICGPKASSSLRGWRYGVRRRRASRTPEAAIANVEAYGPRGVVGREIVLRLGRQLDEHARGDFLKMGFEPWPPRGRDGLVQRIE
jgi:hypothetical protein